MLSNKQILIIQNGFASVVPISDAVARLFYDKLFELRPDFRKLFAPDMASQRSKLVTTLAAVIQTLDRIEELIPEIHALGKRHVGYGTEDEDYEPVGQALLWTLEKALGAKWDAEAAEAWATAYGMIAQVMKEGAAEIQAA